MGNVLLIGNSGVGKSTLLNAVLGDETAVTGWGISGTTKECKIYGDETSPFRVIDSMGFEPGFFERRKAIRQIRKWSEKSAEKASGEDRINVIWFCVEGTSSKLFGDAISALADATHVWKTVPIIVVITKSYSKAECDRNIEMVKAAVAKHDRVAKNLKRIIPVVASTYPIDDSTFVAPFGVPELIEETIMLMPEGEQAALNDASEFVLGRKRVMSRGTVVVATAAAAATGMVPVPEVDTAALAPIISAEVKTISKVFGIENNDDAKKFMDAINDASLASMAAKALLSGLKATPLNLPMNVINAVVSGAIVGGIGTASIVAFEKIYRGEKSLENVEWVRELIETVLDSKTQGVARRVVGRVGKNASSRDVAEAVIEAIEDIDEGKGKCE